MFEAFSDRAIGDFRLGDSFIAVVPIDHMGLITTLLCVGLLAGCPSPPAPHSDTGPPTTDLPEGAGAPREMA